MNQIRIRIVLEHETADGSDLSQQLRDLTTAAAAAGYTIESGISETFLVRDLRPADPGD